MPIKLIDLINENDMVLDRAGIEVPRRNVERMLESILGLTRVELYLDPQREITDEERRHLAAMVKRRLDSEPLQYILGETEFFGLKFRCDPRGLIPRPETEFVVSTALELTKDRKGLNILDLACGSGNIIISIAVNYHDEYYFATDISSEAINLSRENAVLNDVTQKIKFYCGDLFDPFEGKGPKFDLILSNPPYIKNSDFENLHEQIRKHEPRQALLSGDDGLDFIKRMLQEAPSYLKSDGYLIFEIGMGQVKMIRQLSDEYGNFAFEKTVKDYNDIDRILVLRVMHSSGT